MRQVGKRAKQKDECPLRPGLRLCARRNLMRLQGFLEKKEPRLVKRIYTLCPPVDQGFL